MATLYLRKNRWWIAWMENGVRVSRSTGLIASEKEEALKAKVKLERELTAAKRLGLPPAQGSTFRAYRKRWIQARRDQGVGSVDDDEGRLKHIQADLDNLQMEDVRPRHIRDLVLRLRREAKLAPRSIRHIFGVLHRLFEDARIDELILANPCTLRRGDLPPKMDKDPTWRAGAVFSRSEAEQLLSDTRIPEERRTLYGVLFLAGLRIGEASALRWRALDSSRKPLGCLLVSASFNRKKNVEKGVKVEGKTRSVPVHPVLAKLLAAWRLGGWHRHMGRTPTDDDLLLPAPTGNNQRDPTVHANLLRDLKNLGLRPRRTHDTRRTFVSLALSDGARKEILEWVTHGPPGDIISLYTTLPWEPLCQEVSKLNVRLQDAATPLLHRASSPKNSE